MASVKAVVVSRPMSARCPVATKASHRRPGACEGSVLCPSSDRAYVQNLLEVPIFGFQLGDAALQCGHVRTAVCWRLVVGGASLVGLLGGQLTAAQQRRGDHCPREKQSAGNTEGR